MGRTNRQYHRFMKFDRVTHIKSHRNQFPIMKRYSHHQHRHCNKYTDELSFAPFSYNKKNLKENVPNGNIRNGRYTLEQYFDYGSHEEISMRAKLQEQRRNLIKNENYSRAGKNGLFCKDLLLMAWKMLKRRGNTQPFKGHRNSKQLHKRELSFIDYTF